MCVTNPGQVVAIENGMAVVDTDGRRMKASLLLEPDTAVGDWVVVATGTVLQILDPEEAAEIRALLALAADETPLREALLALAEDETPLREALLALAADQTPADQTPPPVAGAKAPHAVAGR